MTLTWEKIYNFCCSGFGPGTSNCHIKTKLIVPRLVLECDFEVDAKVGLLVPFHAIGHLTAIVSKYLNLKLHIRKYISSILINLS